MKQITYLLFATILISFFSCNKESITTTEDNIPEIEVQEIILLDDEESPPIGVIAGGETALSTFVLDSVTMEVHNYSIVCPSSYVGAPEAIFAGVWTPPVPETELQATVYTIEFVSILSEEGVEVISEWEESGADPDTAPDFESYFTYYETSGLTIDVSNITETTADVVINGNIEDDFAVLIPISGSFTADLYD